MTCCLTSSFRWGVSIRRARTRSGDEAIELGGRAGLENGLSNARASGRSGTACCNPTLGMLKICLSCKAHDASLWAVARGAVDGSLLRVLYHWSCFTTGLWPSPPSFRFLFPLHTSCLAAVGSSIQRMRVCLFRRLNRCIAM